MEISSFLQAATGQFGALVVALSALYLLMSHHKETLDRMNEGTRLDEIVHAD